MEAREQLAREIAVVRGLVLWDILPVKQSHICGENCQEACYREADLILKFLYEAGWVSPEEQNAQNQKDIENERALNREAAHEERRLNAEVQYWKDKNYRY